MPRTTINKRYTKNYTYKCNKPIQKTRNNLNKKPSSASTANNYLQQQKINELIEDKEAKILNI